MGYLEPGSPRRGGRAQDRLTGGTVDKMREQSKRFQGIREGIAALLAAGGLGASAGAATFVNVGLNPQAVSLGGQPAPAGAAWSELQHAGMVANAIFGFSNAMTANARVADDFTITDPGGWSLTSLRFFQYQTGSSTSASSITGLNFRIWSGRPGDPGAAIIFGDAVTNRLTGTSWAQLYRTANTVIPPAPPPGTTRPIMRADCNIAGLALPPGTYWLDWQAEGAMPSGPFTPPATTPGARSLPGWNGRTFFAGAWSDAIDNGSPGPNPVPMDFAFEIEHTVLGGGLIESNWAAPVNGAWGVATNWDPPGVPNNMIGQQSYAATIGVPGLPYTVSLDIPVTVTNLFLTSPNATLDLTTSDIVVEGDYEQRPGSVLRANFGGPGSITVQGDALLVGATLDNVPAFISHGELIIANSLVDGDAPATNDICDSDIEHDGKRVSWTGTKADGPGAGPEIIFDGVSVFNHYDGSVFEIESNATMQQLYMPFFTATFNNFGVVRKQNSTGTTSMLNFVFNNTGLVEVLSGTLVINGVPLPSGALQTGAWTVRSNATLGFGSAQVLSLAPPASITFDGPNSNFTAPAGLRSNAGAFTLSGGRDVGFSPSTGALINSGLLSCGPGSVMSVAGALQCMPTGNVLSTIAAATGLNANGSFGCTGTAALGGALSIELAGMFQPVWGNSWTVLTYASRTGDFTTFNTPPLGNPNLIWWRERNPTNYRVGVRHMADTDHDGDVDFADLNRVLGTFGQMGPDLLGDANGDGQVNFLDLNIVLSAFGQQA